MKKVIKLILAGGVIAALGYLKCMHDIAKQNPGETITVKFGKLGHMSMTEGIKNKKGSDSK